MTRRSRLLFAAAPALLALAAPAGLAQVPEAGTATVISGEARHVFRVEVADEPDEITTGLMFRDTLAADAGMLFDFGEAREANMWMKNVTVPLDMLFLAADGEVLAIARKAVPGSERRINPGVPVTGVLEILGGQARVLGLEPGDVVVHSLFGPTDGE